MNNQNNPTWRNNQDKRTTLKKKNRLGNKGLLGIVLTIVGSAGISYINMDIVSTRLGLVFENLIGNFSYLSYLILFIGYFLAMGMMKANRVVVKELAEEEHSSSQTPSNIAQEKRWIDYLKKTYTYQNVITLLLLVVAVSPVLFKYLPLDIIKPLVANGVSVIGVITNIPAFVALVLYIVIIFKAMGVLSKVEFSSDPIEMIYNTMSPIINGFEYIEDKGIEQELFDDTKLFYTGIRYKSKNYIKGKYKGVAFQQADIDYNDVDFKSVKNLPTRTTEAIERERFKGRFIMIESEKKIDGHVIIKNKNNKHFNESYIKEAKLVKVLTEDDEFNRTYDIFATSEHEAFYVLSPAIMERLKTFEGFKSGEDFEEGVAVSFKDSTFSFAISNTRDTFYGLYFVASGEREVVKRILTDMSLITDSIVAIKTV